MSFSFYIARRYLRSRRRSRFLSRVGVLAVTGIALGVMVLDLTLSIMNGFGDEMRRTFVDSMPMINVSTSDPYGFIDLGAVVDSIGAVPGVVGVAPYIRQEAIVTTRGAFGKPRNRAALVWGVDPVLQETVTPLAEHLLPGRLALERLERGGAVPRIILGADMATALVAGPGDTVIVTAPSGGGEIELDQIEAESRRFVVAGYLDTGMFEFDSRFAYVDIDAARSFFGYGPDGATEIGVKVADMMRAPRVAERIEEKLGPDFHTIDWIALNRDLFQWMKIEKIVMFLLLALIVLVAAFNIIGILTMMVGERNREIGILLSMGARPRQIQGVFMVNGIWLGMVGAAVGSLLGWIGGALLTRYGFRLPGDVYFVDHLPIHMQATDFLYVACGTILITILTTLVPSREASRLQPMEIIRYT